MAEETHKTSEQQEHEQQQVVVVAVDPESSKPHTKIELAPQPEPEPKTNDKKLVVVDGEEEKVRTVDGNGEEKIGQSVSFKEESNVVNDLINPEKKALDELKLLIKQALVDHQFTKVEPKPAPVEGKAKEEEKEETSTTALPVEEESKTDEKCKVPVADVIKEEEEKSVDIKLVVEPPEEEKVVVVEKPAATAIGDDGAKTVEAIEETLVSVSVPATEEPVSVTRTTEEASPPVEESKEVPEVPPPPPEEISIWGIRLLGEGQAEEKSNVLLLKFLRARDFKPKEAFAMIKNTVQWRKEFGIDTLLEQDLEKNDLDKAVFMQGFDKEGHPVCYNVYGQFQDKALYNNNFSDEEKRLKFLKWRIQFLEKSIRKLEFSSNGICTIVQVNDLKNAPGPHRRELRQAYNQALHFLQDNYPEFVAKQVFINVPWWYLAFHRMISPFITQRSKSKFVFAGPSATADTLFKYIAPEQVPVEYGGLSRDGEQEFGVTDATTEVTIKPATKHTVEIPVSETSLVVWELRVVGWDISYGAEFVPTAEEGYTVIVEKNRKIALSEEALISNRFNKGEAGKIVLTIDNESSKKKKLLYRFKTKPSAY